MDAATVLVSAARAVTTTRRTTRVTNSDEDYENPIGEVLDDETVDELAKSHLVYNISKFLGLGGKWPFI